MARRPALTPKQTVAFIAALAWLQSPLICFVIYLGLKTGRCTPQQIALFGIVNLASGVSLNPRMHYPPGNFSENYDCHGHSAGLQSDSPVMN